MKKISQNLEALEIYHILLFIKSEEEQEGKKVKLSPCLTN
jgi:hypothetical protein